MYERFSDRARKVMQMANQEALRLNHDSVGTEHILVGLAKEGSGVAAGVLKNLGADLARIRLEVEGLVTPVEGLVTMGRLPLAPISKKVLQHAIAASGELGHNYQGTEHLLVGLLREPDGVAARVLNGLGITHEKVFVGIQELLAGKAEVVEKWLVGLQEVICGELEDEKEYVCETTVRKTITADQLRRIQAILAEKQ